MPISCGPLVIAKLTRGGRTRGRRKLAKQALRGFVGIRREGRDIDERGFQSSFACPDVAVVTTLR
jgi:hypothetical protein